MTKIRINPSFAISLELALIAMSISSLALIFGILPAQKANQQMWIDQHSKSMAVQFSLAVQTGNEKTVQNLVDLSLKQYPKLQSIALKLEDKTAIGTENHDDFWNNKSEQQKSGTNISFEIPRPKGKPLELQLCYFPEIKKWYQTDNFKLGIIVFLGTFIMYITFIRKLLKKAVDSTGEQNSEQVNEIFNTMTESVVVIDDQEKILLANNEFLKLTGQSFQKVKDEPLSSFNWIDKPKKMPWTVALQEKNAVKGIQFSIRNDSGEEKILIFNSTPIKGKEGQINGIMVSMNDVTKLHKQNKKIKEAMTELKKNHQKIQSQNTILKQMSMQDPLTGCLNRRAFYETLDKEWNGSKRYGYELSCIMMDIDFFKKINDNYGHSKGDEVLKVVSKLVLENVRKSDHVCRYGGEEFCILMPHTNIEASVAAAEKIRRLIEESYPGQIRTTISIGISAGIFNAATPQELIDQADKALYYSKESGRNQHTRWDYLPEEEQSSDSIVKSNHLSSDEDIIKSSYLELPFQAVNALISALEQRDTITGLHCKRVADICVTLAKGLMNQFDLYVLEVAALLHDIGKISVPDEILSKPSKLTNDELAIMNYHLRRGTELLEDAFHSSELTGIIKYRSAWYGGTPGKPEIPTGERIPLRSRIISVATAFDSMTNNQPYRQAISPEEAIKEINNNTPKQFDPVIVARLTEIVSARTEHRDFVEQNEDDIKALKIGLEIEKLICAIEAEDYSLMNDLANSLAKDATSLEIPEVAEPATILGKSIQDGMQMIDILPMVNKIITECTYQCEKMIANANINIQSELDTKTDITEAEPSAEK